jgi:hypothetical protein
VNPAEPERSGVMRLQSVWKTSTFDLPQLSDSRLSAVDFRVIAWILPLARDTD